VERKAFVHTVKQCDSNGLNDFSELWWWSRTVVWL
jgi:hypothetical protein